MAKKQYDPLVALNKAFQSEVEDLELQERYDRFNLDLEHAKKMHNELVVEVNPMLNQINALRDVIMQQAVLGIIAEEAINKLKELETKVDVLVAGIKKHKEKIDYNDNLIKKYRDHADVKLFVWYQAFKAVDPETKPWIEWKETYKDKII